MLQIFDSCVFQSLEKCKEKAERKEFNIDDYLVAEPIVTVNEKWKYVFMAHKPQFIKLCKILPDEDISEVSMLERHIASFRMNHLSDDLVAETVARMIEEVESH